MRLNKTISRSLVNSLSEIFAEYNTDLDFMKRSSLVPFKLNIKDQSYDVLINPSDDIEERTEQLLEEHRIRPEMKFRIEFELLKTALASHGLYEAKLRGRLTSLQRLSIDVSLLEERALIAESRAALLHESLENMTQHLIPELSAALAESLDRLEAAARPPSPSTPPAPPAGQDPAALTETLAQASLDQCSDSLQSALAALAVSEQSQRAARLALRQLQDSAAAQRAAELEEDNRLLREQVLLQRGRLLRLEPSQQPPVDGAEQQHGDQLTDSPRPPLPHAEADPPPLTDCVTERLLKSLFEKYATDGQGGAAGLTLLRFSRFARDFELVSGQGQCQGSAGALAAGELDLFFIAAAQGSTPPAGKRRGPKALILEQFRPALQQLAARVYSSLVARQMGAEAEYLSATQRAAVQRAAFEVLLQKKLVPLSLRLGGLFPWPLLFLDQALGLLLAPSDCCGLCTAGGDSLCAATHGWYQRLLPPREAGLAYKHVSLFARDFGLVPYLLKEQQLYGLFREAASPSQRLQQALPRCLRSPSSPPAGQLDAAGFAVLLCACAMQAFRSLPVEERPPRLFECLRRGGGAVLAAASSFAANQAPAEKTMTALHHDRLCSSSVGTPTAALSRAVSEQRRRRPVA